MPSHAPLSVSAKGLGDALPGSCPRCLWVSLHCDLPYQRFPGVFNTIDRFVKHSVHAVFDSSGKMPEWFPEIGRVVAYERDLSYRRFSALDRESDVELAGSPDDVFKLADGSYHIVDYKTARLTPGQAEYLPIYEVQLNAYAYLAERIGISPVRGLSLVYLQPVAERNLGSGSGPAMQFEVATVPVTLRPDELIPPLLRAARKAFDMAPPPASREDCEDCARLAALVNALGDVPR